MAEPKELAKSYLGEKRETENRANIMSYVVYVNHPTSKARIHKVICPEYIYRKPDTRNGYWSRVFSTYQEAFNFAISTGKKNVNSCSRCCSNQS